MFIGKSLQGSNAFWSIEFWNQSISDVWSVDATAPPPGPSVTPDFTNLDGAGLAAAAGRLGGRHAGRRPGRTGRARPPAG